MRRALVLQFLSSHGASEAAHSSSTFLEHLQGTAGLLEAWGAPEHVQLAGLCHAVYGTATYTPPDQLMVRRLDLRALIGADAERLVYLFCVLRRDERWRSAVRAAAIASPPVPFGLTHRDGVQIEQVSQEEFCQLATLTLANALEQALRVRHFYNADVQDALEALTRVALPAARAAFNSIFTA